MEALAELYEKTGDDEKVQKYTKKIEIIKGNMDDVFLTVTGKRLGD